MARAASQGLRSFQVDTPRCISDAIKPANVRQDFLVFMLLREFAKTACPVVDAEFKVVIWPRRNEIVDEIFRKR